MRKLACVVFRAPTLDEPPSASFSGSFWGSLSGVFQASKNTMDWWNRKSLLQRHKRESRAFCLTSQCSSLSPFATVQSCVNLQSVNIARMLHILTLSTLREWRILYVDCISLTVCLVMVCLVIICLTGAPVWRFCSLWRRIGAAFATTVRYPQLQC